MKNWWKHSKSNVIRGVLAVSCAMLFFMSQKCISFAEVTGKVIPRSVKVRQSPDGNSEVIGSTSSGKTVSIITQATDASGYVWYEVYVDANTTGYIRSDMLEVDASASIPTSTATSSAPTVDQGAGTAQGAENMPETGMENQYATIKARSAIVRSGAATNKGAVCSLPEGTQVIVSGQTEGSDKPWYYITFTAPDGTEKTGYVRSDLVTLGDMVPVEAPPEEQAPQEPQPEEQPDVTPTERNDYEVVNEEGVWWLYDWTDRANGTKQKLEDVLLAAHAQSMNDELDVKTVSTQRIVIIVLIGIIIALVVTLTIMIFKLRDAYYEAYEDDEDEDEEEEEDDRRRSRRREDREERSREVRAREGRNREDREERSRESRNRGDREERSRESRSRGDREERSRESRSRDDRGERRRREETGRDETVRRKSASKDERQTTARRRTSEADKRMPSREISYEDDGTAPVKASPKKKAKNFMIDDEDFEFEFLNMKNKDNDV